MKKNDMIQFTRQKGDIFEYINLESFTFLVPPHPFSFFVLLLRAGSGSACAGSALRAGPVQSDPGRDKISAAY